MKDPQRSGDPLARLCECGAAPILVRELRTPVAAILGCADLIAASQDWARDRVERASTIRTQCERVLSVIDDLEALASSLAAPIARQGVDAAALVAETVELLRPMAQSKNLDLFAEFAGPIPPRVAADRGQLKRVLTRIIENAVSLTQSGGVRVLVRAAEEGKRHRIRFDVADTGAGMTPEHIAAAPHIEPNARHRGGLALLIAEALARSMGGQIEIESLPGHGSTIGLTIAFEPFDPGRDEAPLRGRILLIQPEHGDPAIPIALGEAGAIVRTMPESLCAVECARQAERDGTPFDMILIDSQLPGAHRATGELRRTEYTRPIVALVGSESEGVKCLGLGCDDAVSIVQGRARLLSVCARWLDPASRVA